jgi:hypothetical protein
MRALRGQDLYPTVQLASANMNTKVGAKKLRPEFKIVEGEWISFEGGPTPARIGGTPIAAIGKPVAPPTLAEEIGDEIPEFGPPQGDSSADDIPF